MRKPSLNELLSEWVQHVCDSNRKFHCLQDLRKDDGCDRGDSDKQHSECTSGGENHAICSQ
jgi:hypothetical protein